MELIIFDRYTYQYEGIDLNGSPDHVIMVDGNKFFTKKLPNGKCMVYQSRRLIFNETDAKEVYYFCQDLIKQREEDRMVNIEYFFKVWLRKRRLEGLAKIETP